MVSYPFFSMFLSAQIVKGFLGSRLWNLFEIRISSVAFLLTNLSESDMPTLQNIQTAG